MLKKKKKGLKQPSAEGRGRRAGAGGGEPASPSGHTSCCQLLSQASRYPGGMRRRLGCPLNPVLAPEPRESYAASSPLLGYLWPSLQGQGPGRCHWPLPSHVLFQTMGTRMFHPSSPLTVSPSSPNPRPTALPGLGHPMNT